MKVVILSAGQGKRLLPLTEDRPKCALLLGDRSALEWQLEALAAGGASEAVVVTGFQAARVEDIVRRFGKFPVRLSHNPFYAHCDNLGTCWTARHEMTDPFVLLNGDSMFQPDIFRRLAASPDGHPVTLMVNAKEDYDEDDMKVIAADGLLRRVDKQLPLEQVSGESIGMIRFQGPGAGLFRKQLEAMMAEASTLNRWYLSAVDALAQQGLAGTESTNGFDWCEIDDHADLAHARRLVPGWCGAEMDGQRAAGKEL